ncbi:UDP-N-acetylmuramate--L-alanine ligase, partial [bacterium]|nr:UDP-N-acetylmuramate--L-alanine ligase [bacterium]
VLTAGGLDPTVVVGGTVKTMGTGARLGSSEYIVAEADESDGSFLKLSPTMAVITTIDEEHLDFYKGIDEIKEAFIRFANSIPFYGCSVVCLDQHSIQSIIPDIHRRVVSYGLTGQVDVQGYDIESSGELTSFSVIVRGEDMGRIEMHMPGLHNIYNSLAAVAVGLELGVEFGDIARSLKEFEGIARRFEIKGEVNDVLVLDDYGHHPAEIGTTLAAAAACWNRRLVVLFQPHRYTRTQKLSDEFGRSFYDADVLMVTGIYAASETPIEGVSGANIVEAAIRYGHRDASYIEDMDELFARAVEVIRPGDVVVTLGAGDIYKVGDRILTAVSEQENS